MYMMLMSNVIKLVFHIMQHNFIQCNVYCNAIYIVLHIIINITASIFLNSYSREHIKILNWVNARSLFEDIN